MSSSYLIAEGRILLKKIIKKIMRSLGVMPEASPSSWELYRDYVKIHPTAIIAPTASITIFNLPATPQICLEIGEGSHVFSTFALIRPEARIRIGKRCQLGNSQFICADNIEIEDDVLMAWGVTVMDNDSHSLEWEFRQNDVLQCYEDYQMDRTNFIKNKDWSHVAMKPIVIGNKAWIGFNVAILKGISIGHESVIGAGSVVARDVPPNTVVAGNPAKVVKYLCTGDSK